MTCHIRIWSLNNYDVTSPHTAEDLAAAGTQGYASAIEVGE